MQPDAVDRGYADSSADHLPHFHKLAHQFLVNMENFFGSLIDAIALARELKLFLAAIYEEVVEMLFHCPGLLADGGLGNAIEAGGLGEAFGFYEIGENLEIIDLHGVDGWARKEYYSI